MGRKFRKERIAERSVSPVEEDLDVNYSFYKKKTDFFSFFFYEHTKSFSISRQETESLPDMEPVDDDYRM